MRLHYLSILFLFFVLKGQGFQKIESDTKIDQIKTTLDSIEYWIENDYLNKALKIIDKTEETVLQSGSDKHRARIYRLRSALLLYLNDPEGFKMYLDLASDWQDKVKDEYGGIFVNNLKGLYHKRFTKDYDLSILYLNKAIEEAGKPKYEEQIIDVYFNVTSVYYQKRDWEKCNLYAQKTIELAKKYNKKIRLSYLYYYSGVSLTNMGDYDGAISQLEIGEAITNQITDTSKVSNNYPLYIVGFAKVYDKKQDYKKANKYYNEYMGQLSERNNAFLEKYSRSIKSYKDLQLAEKENEKIVLVNEYQKKQLRLSKYLIFAAVGVILTLIIIVFLQYNNSKLKNENNSLLAQKNIELQEAKEKVESAYKQKTLFLNSITHELRTPLHAITGISHLLNTEGASKKERKKQLEILQFSGKYLLRFVNDIIEMNTSDDYDTLSVKKTSFDLTSFLNKVKDSINFFITEDNDNAFEFFIDSNPSHQLIGDSECLSRILISTISGVSRCSNSNTIEFFVQDVDVNDVENKILFSVRNKDLKFSEERLNELKRVLKDKESAVFLAISDENNKAVLEFAVANKLLDKYNTTLRIDSTLEEGTSFDFEITFQIDQNSDIEELFDEEERKRETKILVVEDDKINQLITKKIISGFGYYCDVASDGYEAVQKNENNQYDLIFMDIMMDGIDGFETTKRIRNMGIEIPIIALTAISEKENKDRFREVGISVVVNKPFEPIVLKREIEASLSKRL
ncbi:response regulator [Aquimarina sediminis]|uniref:response regulator n=1 Tax=Aquimarina sediminis TaxID=2070536 RepID=UPI000CA01F74|nr:response regulator [Aquimarina sediminis]